MPPKHLLDNKLVGMLDALNRAIIAHESPADCPERRQPNRSGVSVIARAGLVTFHCSGYADQLVCHTCGIKGRQIQVNSPPSKKVI